MGWLFFLVCECTVQYIKWTPRYTCLNCLLTLHPAVGERDSWNILRDSPCALIVGYTLVITHKLRHAFLLWRRWVTYVSYVSEWWFSLYGHEAVPACEVCSSRNADETVIRHRTLLKYLTEQLFVMVGVLEVSARTLWAYSGINREWVRIDVYLQCVFFFLRFQQLKLAIDTFMAIEACIRF